MTATKEVLAIDINATIATKISVLYEDFKKQQKERNRAAIFPETLGVFFVLLDAFIEIVYLIHVKV
ncbi:MAG TPA: hypothetical protein ENN36_08805 [Candidatus Bathyarchaeota archaeon]|nr:hypothetical protein [Candidatus Bathyarchaeota archaeon]